MNNKTITIPYADAIEYGENTSALFKALGIGIQLRLSFDDRAYVAEYR